MSYSPNEVKSWLEWAGAKILVLSVGRTKPDEYRTYWPDVPPDASLAYGSQFRDVEFRPIRPSADEIPFIDEILALVVVIPDHTRRRIVSSRALVKPISGRPIFGWDRLAQLLHVDKRTVKRHHGRGLEEICKLAPEPTMRRIAGFLDQP